eukprot:CAMPEP_0179027988 /NCGR_PEP_ID=MMETSP0796-20121207/9319_1 /TAXON_ID=73915 /ORGANISM="Pyrodinium bahamense, Strain pbaha01" /LENGTH=199 /DNA_ID=CAMNT_0020724127 /DNA_START=146 /DNA_END=745 /DNA_ORIENTATION=-
MVWGLPDSTMQQLVKMLLLGHVNHHCSDRFERARRPGHRVGHSRPLALAASRVAPKLQRHAQVVAPPLAQWHVQWCLCPNLKDKGIPVQTVEPALGVLHQVRRERALDVPQAALPATIHYDPLGLLGRADDATGDVTAEREGQPPLLADAPLLHSFKTASLDGTTSAPITATFGKASTALRARLSTSTSPKWKGLQGPQ